MKIFWVTQTDFKNNLDIATWREMALELNELDNKVKLLIPSLKNEKLSSFDGLEVIFLPYPRKRFLSSLFFQLSLFFFLLLKLRFKDHNFVIFDHYCIFTVLPFNILAKLGLLKTKFILDVRSVPVDSFGLDNKIQQLRFKVSIYLSKYLCNGITVITTMYMEKIAKKFGVKEKQMSIWTSGVSLELFNPKNVKSLREKFKLVGRFVIMYHGSLSLSRGLSEAIQSISLLKDEIPELCLFLIGRGDAEDELKRIVKYNGLENNVVIHKPVEYRLVPSFIESCDVGLLPLPDILWWKMSSPLKLLEYLAMSKPVVLTDIEAHRQIIKGRECGIFINSCKPSDIRDGILKAYSMGESLKELGYSGRKLVDKEFSWREQAKKLNNFLEQLNH